jgi:hypothetical protein
MKAPVSVPVRKGELRVGAAQASFSFFGLEVTGIEPKEDSAMQINQAQQIKISGLERRQQTAGSTGPALFVPARIRRRSRVSGDLTFSPAVHFSLTAPAQGADSEEQESGTRAIDEGLSEYEDVLHNDLTSPPEGRSEVNVEAGDLVVSDHAVRVSQQFTQRDLDTCSLHPSFKQQLDWRYAEDMCVLDLVHAREAAMQARGDLNASVEEVLEATERCSDTLLAVQNLQNHPEQQAGRDAWSGVGLLVMSTPESFFVVAVLDVLWFQHPHLTPDCSPVHVEDEVMAINGVSTMLLTSGEVEQLLMGPQGSSCILTLASPRFDMSDGIRMVELLRHNNNAPAQQALI